jgi:hypothetical protein
VLLAEGEDDVLEYEVDSSGEEGRCDDETADLHFESYVAKWIEVEQYSSNIACPSQQMTPGSWEIESELQWLTDSFRKRSQT